MIWGFFAKSSRKASKSRDILDLLSAVAGRNATILLKLRENDFSVGFARNQFYNACMYEVEAKYKIDEFSALISKLDALEADFLGKFEQTDTFFDRETGEIKHSGCGLRIRRQVVLTRGSEALHDEDIVTFKGAVLENCQAKKRAEYETQVDDADALERIFAGLGYRPVVVIQKHRSSYRLGDARVELDELPLIGRFVEIEAPSAERVCEVTKMLGITAEHCKRSYLHELVKAADLAGVSVDKIVF